MSQIKLKPDSGVGSATPANDSQLAAIRAALGVTDGGVTPIANDLTTNDPTKALSAAQGVALKAAVDAVVGGGPLATTFPTNYQIPLDLVGGRELGLAIMAANKTMTPAAGAVLNGNANFALQIDAGTLDYSAFNLLGDAPLAGATYEFSVVQRTAGTKPIMFCTLAVAVGGGTTPTPPGQVLGLSLAGTNLTWSATATATSYVVEKSTDGSTGWASVGTPSTPAFVVSGASGYYRVKAVNGVGPGEPSAPQQYAASGGGGSLPGYTTNFAGTDAASLGAGWSSRGGSSPAVYGRDGFGYQTDDVQYARAVYTHNKPNADFHAEIDMTANTGSAHCGVTAHDLDVNNYIAIVSDGDGFVVSEIVDSALNPLFSHFDTPVIIQGLNTFDVTFSTDGLTMVVVVNGLSTGPLALGGPLGNGYGVTGWGKPRIDTRFELVSLS